MLIYIRRAVGLSYQVNIEQLADSPSRSALAGQP